MELLKRKVNAMLTGPFLSAEEDCVIRLKALQKPLKKSYGEICFQGRQWTFKVNQNIWHMFILVTTAASLEAESLHFKVKAQRNSAPCLIKTTSYWVISPLGSTGSSHFRKIMSSSGVKVSDSGAIPPGTIRNCQNKHLSGKLKC